MSTQGPFALDRRRMALAAAVAVGLAAGAFAAVGSIASFGDVWRSMRHAEHAWIALGVLGLALSYAGFVPALRGIARADGGPVFGWWTAARIVGLRSGATIAFAGGALAVDAWAYRRAGRDLRDVARRVVALDFGRVAVLAVYGAAAGAAALALGLRGPQAAAVGWLAGLPLGLGGAALLARAARGRRGPEAGRERGLSPRAASAARRAVRAVGGGLALFGAVAARPRRHADVLLGLGVFWIGNFVVLSAAAHALRLHVPVAALVLSLGTAHLLTIVPLPAGASGGLEATLAWLLTLYGAPLAAALPAVFVYRFFSFWLPIVVALAFAPTVRGLRRDLARPRAPQRPSTSRRASSRGPSESPKATPS